jgi:hypothetical protein
MNNQKLKFNQNSDVFVINIEKTNGDNKFYLLVFKTGNGLPINASNFPTAIQNNIANFEVFLNHITTCEIEFDTNNADGLVDNFGNIYAPISNFD